MFELNKFNNPGKEYRPVPFWSWNDKLEESKLRKQIRCFKEMGFGGVMPHSRTGLNTEYLGPDWFRLFEACIDEAKKNDMTVWLYDEDRFPSGAAGGLVTKDHSLRARRLCLRKSDIEDGDILFAVRFGNNVQHKFSPATPISEQKMIGAAQVRYLLSYRRIKSREDLQPGEELAAFYNATVKENSWFNGQTAVNLLDKKAIRRFIETTYDAYYENFGKHFSGLIPAIFTDEPSPTGFFDVYTPDNPENGPCYDNNIKSHFKKISGRNLDDCLPEIFFAVENPSRIKYLYMETIAHLFETAFARQLGEWCESHGIAFNGHWCYEEWLSRQAVCGGGSTMRFMRHMQIPGTDSLNEYRRGYDAAKMCSSVARQYGRQKRTCEIFGCTGWDFSFKGFKAEADWQFALGINVFIPHLSFYSMRGEAKRDYPGSIGYQSPWHKEFKYLSDYFSRISYIMQQGKEQRDVLVIFPVESAWVFAGMGWWTNPHIKETEFELYKLRDCLLGNHIDFDYGEEQVLSDIAEIIESRLKVGQAEYNIVIIPAMHTIRSSTLQILEKFRQGGGQVIFWKDAPQYVDAESDNAASLFSKICERFHNETELVASLGCKVSIANRYGQEQKAILYNLRFDQNYQYLFVCNTGLDNASLVPDVFGKARSICRNTVFEETVIKIFTDYSSQIFELDPLTGKVYLPDAEFSNGHWKITTSFGQLQSRIFITSCRDDKIPVEPNGSSTEEKVLFTEEKVRTVKYSEPNVIPLELAEYKIEGTNKYGKAEILEIDNMMRSALKLPERNSTMVQPWAQQYGHAQGRIELKSTFNISESFTASLELGIESPENFSITLNGEHIPNLPKGWWCDESIETIILSNEVLRAGSNKLVLTCIYDEKFSGLETVYLLGEFGCDENFALIPRPKKLPTGDWTKLGLPFYSGNVTYVETITIDISSNKTYHLLIPEFKGTAAVILINNKKTGIVFLDPCEVDITPFLEDGDNLIEIEILGHRKNTFGPLHEIKRYDSYGPNEFRTKDNWQKPYNLEPLGLLSDPQLIVKSISDH